MNKTQLIKNFLTQLKTLLKNRNKTMKTIKMEGMEQYKKVKVDLQNKNINNHKESYFKNVLQRGVHSLQYTIALSSPLIALLAIP